MKLVLATGNPGKVGELRTLLAPGGFELLTPGDVGFPGRVEESGATYAGNALLKARALAAAVSLPVLADDSGLEVEALGGAPGVHSARYSGPGEADRSLSQDAANRAKLLRALQGEANRRARFVCVLCYLAPGAAPAFFQGICEGEIVEAERGEGGFGYDPLIRPGGHDRTFAELPAGVKDSLSHRGRAVALFLASLGKK